MRGLLLALLVLAPVPAVAQDKVDEAKTYFEAGRQAYEASDYVTAIRSFEQAYAAAPRPPIAFSLAQAYRKQFVVDRDAAKLKRAVLLYRRYLEEVPQGGRREDAVGYLAELQPQLERLEAQRPVSSAPQPPPAATQIMVMSRVKGATASFDGAAPVPIPVTRDVKPGPHKIGLAAPGHFPEVVDGLAVEGRLVVVEASPREMPARLALSATEGAEVMLDGRLVGTAPLAAPVEVRAGKHHLAVMKGGHHSFSRAVDLERGQVLSVDADLSTTGQRRAAYVLLGGAGLLLGAGGVTTLMALRAQADAREILDRRETMNITAADLDEYNRLRDRRDTLVTSSAILYGAGAACAVAGLFLWVTDSPRAEAPPPSGGTILPTVGPDEIGATYTQRF